MGILQKVFVKIFYFKNKKYIMLYSIIKKVYNSKTIKNNNFRKILFFHNLIIKKINKWKKIYKINIWDLKLKFKSDLSNSYMTKIIYMRWYYEKKTSKYIINNLKKWDIFLDVWANLWYYSLLASKKNWDTWKVFSFEPVKSNYENLIENIKINNLKNIEYLNIWLWNENKEFDININPNNIWNNSVLLDHNYWYKEKIKIKRFDDLNLDIDKSKIKFIKIDVEWFEYEAMKWMEKLIDLNKNLQIILEFSPEFYHHFDENYWLRFAQFIYSKWFETFDINNNFKKINLIDDNNYIQKNILLKK